MSHRLIPLTLAAMLMATGCTEAEQENKQQATDGNKSAAASTAEKPELLKVDAVDIQAVARVNGLNVTAEEFGLFLREKGVDPASLSDNTQHYADLLRELITMKLMAWDAEKKGLNTQPNVQAEIAYAGMKANLQAALRDYINNNLPSDTELRADYNKMLEDSKVQEFQAAHILLETEDEAKSILEKLAAGEDFAELAKAHSTGPSGPRGGDLGWFKPERMVPPFAAALKDMQKGDTSKAAVKTKFGFHIIQVNDIRNAAAQTFAEFKRQTITASQRGLAEKYIDELHASADIQIPQVLVDRLNKAADTASNDASNK